MLRILSMVAVVGLLTGPARAGDQQTYKIKVKKSTEGTVERVEKGEDSTTTVKITDNQGKLVKEEGGKDGHRYVYTETILERKELAKKATRLKRLYEKASVTDKGETTKLPYEGKTVLIEKKGEKYVFRIEGGEELTGDDAKYLDKEFNKRSNVDSEQLEQLLLPRKAVKVDEEWMVDPAALAKTFREMGYLLDPEKTTAAGKLTRAYKKDGRQFGVLVYRLRLGVKSMGEKGKLLAMQPGSMMTLDLTIDACIDGSSTTGNVTTAGGMQVEALLPSPDQPMFRMSVNVKGKTTGKTVEQK